MMYTKAATTPTPVTVIYLLDVSSSMHATMPNGKRRIDAVYDALDGTIQEMVSRSTKGMHIASRYRVAMLAYSTRVQDLLGGVVPIDVLIQDHQGLPTFPVDGGSTDTAAAFSAAERILQQELPQMGNCPAPLVVHMTDGMYNGDDPTPIAARIMQMGNEDGKVLIENIFISDGILKQPVTPEAVFQWAGVHPNDLHDGYAHTLLNISSPLPDSYATNLQAREYSIQAGVPMMLPAENEALVKLAFTMSGATDTP